MLELRAWPQQRWCPKIERISVIKLHCLVLSCWWRCGISFIVHTWSKFLSEAKGISWVLVVGFFVWSVHHWPLNIYIFIISLFISTISLSLIIFSFIIIYLSVVPIYLSLSPENTNCLEKYHLTAGLQFNKVRFNYCTTYK